MDETGKALARPAASRSLREAIHKARLEEAEQLDHSADLRDGEIARLELLKAELEAVFAELTVEGRLLRVQGKGTFAYRIALPCFAPTRCKVVTSVPSRWRCNVSRSTGLVK